MRLLSLVAALVDFKFPSILAGHGYDVGGAPAREPRDDDDGGGIGTPWIVAVAGLGLVTVAVLVGLSPGDARTRMRRLAPKALILLVIAAPLVAWTAASDEDEATLIVERAIGLDGAPELLVSLVDAGLNTLGSTDGEQVVRVRCLGRDGELVLDAEQVWPFVDEPGYPYPHAHQRATAEQLREADRCRLEAKRLSLEAAVEGALTP